MDRWAAGGVLLLQKWTTPGPPLAPASAFVNYSRPVEIAENGSRAASWGPSADTFHDQVLSKVNRTAATFDDQVWSRLGLNNSDLANEIVGTAGAPRLRSYQSNRDELASALVLNLSIFFLGIIAWLVWQFAGTAQKRIRQNAESTEAGEAGVRSDETAESSMPSDAPSPQGWEDEVIELDKAGGSPSSFLAEEPESSFEERSLGKRNYLTYLLVCVYMCLTLAVVNMLFLMPHGLVGKILFGGWSIFMVLGEVSMMEVYALTVVDGCIVFFFSEFFRKLIEVPEVNQTTERMKRTVWMQGLPTHDSMRWWKQFDLNSNELRRVGLDLNDALTEFLTEQDAGADADGGAMFGERNGSRTSFKETSSDSEQSVLLPAGPPPCDLKKTHWRCQLENGNPFYINIQTKDTQWHPPAELMRASDPSESPVVEEIAVALVLDGWLEAHSKLQQAQEYLVAYEESLDKAEKELLDSNISYFRHTLFRLASAYYDRQINSLRPRITTLQQDLETMKSSKRQISGSAFVTFKHHKYRTKLLEEDILERSHFLAFWRSPVTFFSFGRPPFASVTLSCESTPHPSDVNWSNLHIRWLRRTVVFWTLALLFMLAMIFVVTVVRISELVVPVLAFVRQELDELEKMYVWDHYVPEMIKSKIRHLNTRSFWKALFEQVPTMVLLFINSMVVPEAIVNISRAERSAKKSDAEMRRLLVNFTFLFTTTVVVPFCNVASMSELISMTVETLNDKDAPAAHLQNIIYAMPGVFALKYLMNATFLTNTNQLLQIGQQVYQFVSINCFAVTERDIREYRKAWPFYWGYWYAWTLSIFSLGLIMSIVCPSTLPVAALFFFMKYKVDKHNLDTGVYTMGTDLEGSLAVRVVCYIRMVVGMWWFAMGLCSYVFHYFKAAEDLDHSELHWLNKGGAGLMSLGVVAMMISQLLKVQHLRTIQLFGLGSMPNPQTLDEDNWWLRMAVTLQLLSPERVAEIYNRDFNRALFPISSFGSDTSPRTTPRTTRQLEGSRRQGGERRQKRKEKEDQISWDGPRILGLEQRRKTRMAVPLQRAQTMPSEVSDESRAKSCPM
mmetsp:Transcript_4588/g.7973  ORF Transcript_4588/g.7973 Transcript_4588/m.7973 type:complete len:1070 (+) Transcript_4588:137-3346(+)